LCVIFPERLKGDDGMICWRIDFVVKKKLKKSQAK